MRADEGRKAKHFIRVRTRAVQSVRTLAYSQAGKGGVSGEPKNTQTHILRRASYEYALAYKRRLVLHGRKEGSLLLIGDFFYQSLRDARWGDCPLPLQSQVFFMFLGLRYIIVSVCMCVIINN